MDNHWHVYEYVDDCINCEEDYVLYRPLHADRLCTVSTAKK